MKDKMLLNQFNLHLTEKKIFWETEKKAGYFPPFATFVFKSHLPQSHLTHYQTTNFRLFQTKRVCRRDFQI